MEHFQRVTNPGIATQASRQMREILRSFYTTHGDVADGVRYILAAKQAVGFLLGSASIGVATMGDPIKGLAPSDADIIFLTRETTTSNASYQPEQIERLLQANGMREPHVSVFSLTTLETEVVHLLQLAQTGQNTTGYDARTRMTLLVGILITEPFGTMEERELARDCKRMIITHAQQAGEAGRIFWNSMNQVFRREYVFYEDSMSYEKPKEREAKAKRALRIMQAQEEIFQSRAIPHDRYSLARTIIHARRREIQLPELAQAHVAFNLL